MKKLQQFKESDIPYDILASYGLSKPMIEDLPQSILIRLLGGKETPVMPIIFETSRGERIRSNARVLLVKTEDGLTDVCFIPQWKASKLDDFNLLQQETLLNGDVAIANLPDKGRCYVQYDDNTNQVISVPEHIINRNISFFAKDFNLKDDDEAYLHDGKPLQFPDANKQDNITIGINLKEDKGIQVTKGDISQWRKEKRNNVPKYNFGVNGCWICDDDGDLTYIENEQFTEELKAEEQRMKLCNSARASFTPKL